MDDKDDEFSDEFADVPEEELAESLSRIEESFHQSQQQKSQLLHHFPTRTNANANGFQTAFNEQSAGRQNSSSTFQRPVLSPGIDDFRISHKGQVQGGSILPAGDDEFDDDGAMWRGMDLDRIDNEAIELSQRSQTGNTASKAKRLVDTSRPSGEGATEKDMEGRPLKRARDDNREGPAARNVVHDRSDGRLEAELKADRKRIEELEQQLARKEEEIARFKKVNQTKIGEVSVLRANMNKTVADFSSVLREKEETIAKHKALNSEMKKMHEEQLARNETINAFRHTELATSAHWSSITASVARRRGGQGPQSSQRNYSQSHSQTAAAAVGLTTPTRRNRGSHRNLGSGNDRSGDADRGKKNTGQGEESPSSRRGQLRQQQRSVLDSAIKTKPVSLAFPGFVNSFAKPSEKTPQAASKVVKGESRLGAKEALSQNAVNDDVVFQDVGPPIITEIAPTDEELGPTSQASVHEEMQEDGVYRGEIPTGWSHPQYRYLWAISTYTKRQSFISSLILSHTSLPCSSGSAHAITHSSTIYRLLNASLPSQAPVALHEQYIITTHILLNILSQGTAADAEDRFNYLLDRFAYEDEVGLDKEEKQIKDEEEFWACQILMEDGVKDVLTGVASVLCTMMAISYEATMVERLYDVFVLMRSIYIHQPWMIHAILSTPSLQGDMRDSGMLPASADHSTGDKDLSHPIRLDLGVEKVIVGCVKRLCAKAVNDEKEEDDAWNINTETRERLLQAMVGIMDVMSYEIRDNDTYSLICTHKLKRIIDEPGILATLLDNNRRSTATMRHTIALLIKLSQHPTLWRNVVACKLDPVLNPLPRTNRPQYRSETPLLEVLARVLVDGRVNIGAVEAHAIHCDIFVLLSQLIIQHTDALLLVAESNSILAAIIVCLQIDTGLIWNDDGEEIQSREDIKVINIVERICMNVRLLSHLYIYPKRPTNLAKKLQSPESQSLINGIKHSFILAVSRIAFAIEPDWFDGTSSHLLGTVNEIASNLLELILSPEEMEGAWEMLNDEDEDEDGDDDDEEQQMVVDIGAGGRGRGHEDEEEDVESQTQMDQDAREVIVLS